MIIYHGDHLGMVKMDPRLMYHEFSTNAFGIGIYFTPDIEDTKEYGPYIYSINTRGLKIVHFDKKIKSVLSKKQIKKFENYVKNIRKIDYQIERGRIGPWQKKWAFHAGKENIIEFVEGWNKIVKIDGLYIDAESKRRFFPDEYYDEYCIINPNIKVRRENFRERLPKVYQFKKNGLVKLY